MQLSPRRDIIPVAAVLLGYTALRPHLWLWWRGLVATYTPFELTVFGTFIAVYVPYWLLGLAILWLDLTKRPKWLFRFKVQPQAPPPSRRMLLRLLGLSLFNQFVLHLPTNWLLYRSGRLAVSADPPPLGQTLRYLAVAFVAAEVAFYYPHRLLHHPLLYSRVHKVHHQFLAPTALASIYAHPFEFLFGNMFLATISALLVPCHLLVYWLSVSVGLLSSSLHHSGYGFPFLSTSLAPLVFMHDAHHERFVGNYGTYGWLDRLHGTYRVPSRSEADFARKG